MQRYQLLTGLLLAAALVMQSAQAQNVSVEDLEQRMLDACPAMWEEITADIDAAAVTGDVWQGDTADRDVFIQFMTSAMGPDAPDSAGLNAMADDISTVGAECATQRIGLLDALLQKLPQDAMTALSAMSDQLQGFINDGVPDGMVGFFAGGACPAGWEEYTTARGRYLVALPSGGLNQATVGTALSDRENRPVGRHSHSMGAAGAHSHKYVYDRNDSVGNQEDSSNNTRGAGPKKNTSTNGNHTHPINAAGSVNGTNAPYMQLIACHKGPIPCQPSINNFQSTEINESQTSYTLSGYTVSDTGNNQILVVTVSTEDGRTPTGATFDSTVMTELGTAVGTRSSASMFYVNNPMQTTGDVTVTYDTAPSFRAGVSAAVLDCVDTETAPLANTVTATGDISASVTTSTAATLIYDAMGNEQNGSSSATTESGQTAIINEDLGTGSTWGVSRKLEGATGSTAMGWSGLSGSSSLVIGGFAKQP